VALNSAASGSVIKGSVPSGLANASKFSLGLWLLQNDWIGSRGIWGIGNSVELIQFGATDQLLFFWQAGSQYGQTPVGAFPVGSYHHIGWSFDGTLPSGNSRLLCFVDGAPVSLVYSGTIPATIGAANTSFRICRGVTFGNPANAAQAYLRGWAAALTRQEWQQEMASYWAVRQADLQFDIPEDDGVPMHDQETVEPWLPVDYSQHSAGSQIIVDTLTQVPGPPSVTRRVPVMAI